MGHHHGGQRGYVRRHVARDDYAFNRNRTQPPRQWEFNDKMTFLEFLLGMWVKPVEPPPASLPAPPAPPMQPPTPDYVDLRCPRCQHVKRTYIGPVRCPCGLLIRDPRNAR